MSDALETTKVRNDRRLHEQLSRAERAVNTAQLAMQGARRMMQDDERYARQADVLVKIDAVLELGVQRPLATTITLVTLT